MSTRTKPVFLPGLAADGARRLSPRDHLIRAATAAVAGYVKSGGSDQVFRELYPRDENSATMLKAATAPATLSSSEWPGNLAQASVADFVANLGPASAAAQLIRASMQIDLGRRSAVTVPGVVTSSANSSFVGEGDPIPVRQLAVTGPTLTPRKLATICVFTQEMARTSAIEQIVRAMLIESVAAALDAAMLGTAAATDDAPAGLRAGVAAITATAGGGQDAMVADLAALAGGVAPVAGSQIVFIANPVDAVKIALRAPQPVPYPVFASGGLAAGTVLALATNALATAIDPTPTIDVSTASTLHMEDTTPEQIGSAPAGTDTGGDVAYPTQSMFQTAQIALRLVLGASWTLRTTGAVAWIGGATW